MKKSLLILLIFAMGFAAGHYIPALFTRAAPTIEMVHITHYCSCIEDNPEAQLQIFQRTHAINTSIIEETEDFAHKHGLHASDFGAFIAIDKNGNYTLRSWHSNRTSEVAALADEYGKISGKHFQLYSDALDEAHEIHYAREAAEMSKENPE